MIYHTANLRVSYDTLIRLIIWKSWRFVTIGSVPYYNLPRRITVLEAFPRIFLVCKTECQKTLA